MIDSFAANRSERIGHVHRAEVELAVVPVQALVDLIKGRALGGIFSTLDHASSVPCVGLLQQPDT